MSMQQFVCRYVYKPCNVQKKETKYKLIDISTKTDLTVVIRSVGDRKSMFKVKNRGIYNTILHTKIHKLLTTK